MALLRLITKTWGSTRVASSSSTAFQLSAKIATLIALLSRMASGPERKRYAPAWRSGRRTDKRLIEILDVRVRVKEDVGPVFGLHDAPPRDFCQGGHPRDGPLRV